MNFVIPLILLINLTVLHVLAVCVCALCRTAKLPVVEGTVVPGKYCSLCCYTTLIRMSFHIGCLLLCGCLQMGCGCCNSIW